MTEAPTRWPRRGAPSFAISSPLTSREPPHECGDTLPPEPNGYLQTSGTPGDLPELRRGAGIRGRCHLRFDDTNPDQGGEEYIDAIERDVRWSASTGEPTSITASDYFEQLYEWRAPDRTERLGRRPVAGGDAAKPRDADRAGTNSPWRERTTARKLDLLRRMRAGAFRTGRGCSGQDRMAQAISTCATRALSILHASHPRTARPGVSIRARLRPWSSDAIEHITLPLHARIRGPPGLVRLVSRASPRFRLDRGQYGICASQSHHNGAVQAGAHRIGAWRARQRLGRSAHADAGRASPRGVPADSGARFVKRVGVARPTAWSTSHVSRFSVREGPQPDGLAPDGRSCVR